MEVRELREESSDDLKLNHVTKEEVLVVLKHMKMDKSLGPDQVYPSILQADHQSHSLMYFPVAYYLHQLGCGWKTETHTGRSQGQEQALLARAGCQ